MSELPRYELYSKQKIDDLVGGVAARFAGTPLGTADLNTITTPGHYHQATSASATRARNYPADFGAWNVEVLATGASARIQRATRHWLSGWQQPFGFWERSYNGSTLGWMPWRFFPSQRIDNTAGRAIYTWDDTANREQLIYGDTGWRNIAASLTNGWTVPAGGNGSVWIRRRNYDVTLFIEGLNASGMTSPTFLPPPGAGFLPQVNVRHLLHTAASGPVTAFRTFYAGDGFVVAGANSATPVLYGMLAYTTSEAWPTTLPGLPQATVPNL